MTPRRRDTGANPTETCAKCGQVHVDRFGKPSCTAHRSKVRPLSPCSKPPTPGLDVCATHGVNGRARAAAGRRVATAKLHDELTMVGVPTDDAPLPVVALEQVRIWRGTEAFLRARVQELDQLTQDSRDAEAALIALLGGGKDVREVEAKAPAGIYGRVDPRNFRAERHVVYAMWEDASERVMRFVKMCRDAGVEEARLQIEQDQGRLLGRVIQVSLAGALSLVVAVLARLEADPTLAAAVRDQWAADVPGVVRRAIADVTGAGES